MASAVEPRGGHEGQELLGHDISLVELGLPGGAGGQRVLAPISQWCQKTLRCGWTYHSPVCWGSLHFSND